MVVDYNPETIMDLAKEGIDCRYGDASDSELLNELNLSKESENYKRLLNEVMEMLTMKLTMVSLMDVMLDESVEPVPIK